MIVIHIIDFNKSGFLYASSNITENIAYGGVVCINEYDSLYIIRCVKGSDGHDTTNHTIEKGCYYKMDTSFSLVDNNNKELYYCYFDFTTSSKLSFESRIFK